MTPTAEALSRIDERTKQIADDIAAIKNELTCLRDDVDELKLARARLDGQIDMLWKLVSLAGLAGIAALVKAFMH